MHDRWQHIRPVLLDQRLQVRGNTGEIGDETTRNGDKVLRLADLVGHYLLNYPVLRIVERPEVDCGYEEWGGIGSGRGFGSTRGIGGQGIGSTRGIGGRGFGSTWGVPLLGRGFVSDWGGGGFGSGLEHEMPIVAITAVNVVQARLRGTRRIGNVDMTSRVK